MIRRGRWRCTCSGGVVIGPCRRRRVFLGRGGPWDSKVHDITIERIIRGLYFHHFREVLGNRVIVKCHWYRELSPDLLEATAECQQSRSVVTSSSTASAVR